MAVLPSNKVVRIAIK